MNAPSSISRRGFLRLSALTAGVAALNTPLLAACGGGGGGGAAGGGGGAAGAQVPLPDFVSALKVTPDLPGTPDGVEDGFLSAVKQYPPSVTGPIGAGGDVSALLLTYGPPAPSVGDNVWWQAVNKRANINFKAEITPAADYPAKFGSVMAGNDLPDFVQIPLFMNLPRLSDLLSSRFQDLSDFVSGAKVRAYPNLAGIPTYSWRMARVKGRIYGVPLSRPVVNAPMLVRQDLLDQLGAARPTDAASFEALCQAVTDPRAGRWAMGSDTSFVYNVGFFAQMFGAPVRWGTRPDGSLVKDYETEEFAAAVEYTRKLREAGYFHPDAGTLTLAQTKEQFGGGKIVMYMDGPAGWKLQYDTFGASNPGLDVDALMPFARDGGPARQYLDRGVFSLTGIKQGDPARIEELLRVLNYFAAPYGSEENRLNTAGVEGVDHTVNEKGLPVLTDRGKVEQGVSFNYLMNPAPVLSSADYPAYVQKAYAWRQKVVPTGVSDPTDGFYSETASRVSAQLEKTIGDTLRGIISGRATMADLKPAVDAWRSGGGDKIRAELQDAMAAAPR